MEIDNGELSSTPLPHTDTAAIGLGLSGASQAKADAFLDEQIALVRYQRIDLREQRDLEVEKLREQARNLRIQSWDQTLSLGLKVLGGLIVLFVVVGLGSMVWFAAHQGGLVIDAFSVPPDLTNRGITGQVVATRVLDQLQRMEKETPTPWAVARSAREAQDIKIEIPDTGVSIGELMRYLRVWLGDEVHVDGEVFRTGGDLTVTARYGDTPGQSFSGKDAELDALIEKSAEQLYRASQPVRYADYLVGKKRFDEALALLMPLTRTGTPQTQAFALASISIAYTSQGQWATALRYGREGLSLVPRDPLAHFWLGNEEDASGHTERALAEFRAALPDLVAGHVAGVANDYVARASLNTEAAIDAYLGDFQHAVETDRKLKNGAMRARAMALDLASAHDIDASRLMVERAPATTDGGLPAEAPAFTANLQAVMLGDWPAALATALDSDVRHVRISKTDTLERLVRHFPLIAEARAHTGDFAGAHRIIDFTPLDCYDCVVTRGSIRSLEGNLPAAAYWFALARSEAPSIPEAPWRWGRALLRAGNTKGAIAAFSTASRLGPHFADPLEMWGEALMLQNRSDLAREKFEDANKYAPNWGRLHLKWGEALLWSGDKPDAQKQFAIARSLAMSVADTAELVRFTGSST